MSHAVEVRGSHLILFTLILFLVQQIFDLVAINKKHKMEELFIQEDSPIRTLIEHDTLLIETLGLVHGQIVAFDNKTITPKTIGTGINCLAAGASVGSILGGLALAPITAGASLGLAVTGFAGVVLGSGINLTTDYVQGKKMKEHVKHLRLLGEEHDAQLRNVLKQLEANASKEDAGGSRKVVELFIRNYSDVDGSGSRVLNPRNVVTDLVSATGKIGPVIDAKEASKIPHVINEITSSSVSTSISASGSNGLAAATTGTLTSITLATGIAVTGAVASVGFAIWDVASLIKRWGQVSPTAEMVMKLRMEIERERDFLKTYFNIE